MTDVSPGESADAGDESADASESPWAQTLADATHRAELLEAEGWTVETVRAGHAAPAGPDADGTDLVGIVFIVPSEEGEAVARLLADGVTDYVVFAERDSGTRYLVVEVRNAERRDAVLLVGAFPIDAADDLAEHAHETGRVRTHVRALDETHYGTIEHDDPSLFFPR